MLLKAYYAALKPERTYANVLTTLAGFLFASAGHIDLLLLLATLAGTTAIVMSACAVNNVLDRGIDAQMPRTKKRASVTGVVAARPLLIIATGLGVGGFTVLGLAVNWLTVLVGAIGYIDYVALYSWSKRTTIHSTLIGTISGAAPIVAGYTAVTGQFDATALLLGLVMVFWQMPHFYAIGIFRKADYAAAHLPIWPVQRGVRSTQVWIIVYTLLYVLAVLVLGLVAQTSVFVTATLTILGLYWLLRGVVGFTAQKPEAWARGMFGFSLIILLVQCAGVAVAPVLP